MALKPAHLQWSPDGAIKNADYGDVYFQTGVGFGETRYVFHEGNDLAPRFAALPEDSDFYICELGFGTGLNALLTAQLWCSAITDPASRLHFFSIEKHPIHPDDLAKLYDLFIAEDPALKPFAADVLHQYPPAVEGFHTLHLAGGRVRLTLALGDVSAVLPQIAGAFDAWFLDGFTPSRNPDMWVDGLYPQISARTKDGGTLASFSVAGHMRRGLAAQGFAVEKKKGYGVKWSMTVARKGAETVARKGAETAARKGAEHAPHENTDAPHGLPPLEKTAAVIGAGIAGCAAAYALAERGYHVTVYDRHDRAAAEASGNPRAILYPKMTVDDSALGDYHTHGFLYTRMMLENIAHHAFTPCGVLHLDITADDKAWSQKLIEKQQCPPDLAVWQPRTPFGTSGLLHTLGGMIDPVALCQRLLGHPNITASFGKDIADWKDLPQTHVVVAQANASKAYAETAWLPLQALRGQVTYLRTNAQAAQLQRVLCHEGYLTPAIDGIHYAGATFQKEPFERGAKPRKEDDAENVRKLNSTLPGLGFTAKDIVGSRAAWRAATPDRLAMIGPCPDAQAIADGGDTTVPRLYLSTGYGSHGMTGALLGGEMIACMINGDPLPVPQYLAERLAPLRFVRRALERGTKIA